MTPTSVRSDRPKLPRVAVITDATSEEFWFPKWYKYYSSAFGEDSIHLLTYEGRRSKFKDYNIRCIWDLPAKYSDKIRAEVISNLTQTLLVSYDVVLRCDVDEFIIPDPRFYKNLKDYIQKLEYDYVTAYGVDVFEKGDDGALDFEKFVIVNQRNHGVVNSFLHKTCITTIPLRWDAGFHACSRPPNFNHLYLFHMKFADIRGRVNWFNHMKGIVAVDSSEQEYFSFTDKQFWEHKKWLSSKPCSPNGSAYIFNEREQKSYEDNVSCNLNGVYQGLFGVADTAFILPEIFRDIV